MSDPLSWSGTPGVLSPFPGDSDYKQGQDRSDRLRATSTAVCKEQGHGVQLGQVGKEAALSLGARCSKHCRGGGGWD